MDSPPTADFVILSLGSGPQAREIQERGAVGHLSCREGPPSSRLGCHPQEMLRLQCCAQGWRDGQTAARQKLSQVGLACESLSRVHTE
jgi:hypothetical protein